jgi:AraC-like DNA-binding protein
MKSRFTFLLLGCLQIVMVACQPYGNTSHDMPIGEADKARLQVLDTLMAHYYAANPDSAVYYCYQKIELLKSLNRIETAIESYLFLTELYEFRKADPGKALSSISTAAQLVLENPEVQIRNLYLFINLGNILLQHDLYPEAILAYQQSLMLKKEIPPDAKILAFNNIAQTYQSMLEYDSARVYFAKANKSIANKKDILMAQNYNYFNTLLLEIGQLDSIQHYHQLVEDLVPQIDMKIFEKNKSDSVKAYTEISKIKAVSTFLIAQYYDLTGFYGKADSCYRKVLVTAQTNGFNRLKSKVYFKEAVIWEKQDQTETAIQFADSALQSNLRLNDFEPVVETAKFLSVLYARNGNALLATKYLKLSRDYSDSLRSRETSTKFLNDKAYLAGVNTRLAIKDLRYRQTVSAKVIGLQKMMIYLMLLVGLIAFLSVVAVRIYRKELKRTNLILARRTLEVVSKEIMLDDLPLLTVPKEANDDLISQLDQLIKSEKIHLDPNLSLVNLSLRLNTNRTHLSQIFNEHHQVSFNDYINELRVKEICRLLISSNDKNFTIDHILACSGFNSKSPFYSAFRKFTGVTPEVFKRINSSQN